VLAFASEQDSSYGETKIAGLGRDHTTETSARLAAGRRHKAMVSTI